MPYGESLTHESAVPNNSVPVRRISALAAIQAVRACRGYHDAECLSLVIPDCRATLFLH